MKSSFSNLALGFLLLFTAVFHVHAITFEDWQAAHFTAAELADPAVSGEAASPAGDGLCNLLKYAFDLDPHVAAVEGAPAPQFFGGARALNFLHRSSADDLQYSLEVSSDLAHWSIPNGLSRAATLPLAGVEQWTVLSPYSWPADRPQFLRLCVTRTAAPLLRLDPPQMVRVRTLLAPFGLELHWADRSNAESGFRVERQRVADNAWDLFAVTGPDTIFYADHTVQSGTAYNYRIRAMFAGGQFSAWSESGGVTPAPPGGGGPGGPGSGPPDPDPDTDNDTFKDSLDAYPHDNRRSRDLAVQQYAVIDVSSAVTQRDIQAVALDDSNTVAFAYEDEAHLYSAVVRNGVPDSSAALTITKEHTIAYDVLVWDGDHPGQTKTIHESATGQYRFAPPYWPSSGRQSVNAAGHLTGSITYQGPGEEGTLLPQFSRVFVATGATPTDLLPPPPAYLLNYRPGDWPGTNVGFLGNSDTCFADFGFYNSLIGDGVSNHWFRDLFPEGYFHLYGGPGPSSFSGLAAGWFYNWNFTGTPRATPPATQPDGYVLWPSLTPLAHPVTPLAVNDSGTVLGYVGTVGDAAGPANYLALATDGQPLTAALPALYKKQLRFPATDSAWLNNQGDLVLGNAEVLEGPEDAPVWSVRTILWRKATDELFIVQFPVGLSSVQQFNNAGCFTAIADKAILDAQGQPVLDAYNNPTYRAVAQLLLPVEIKVHQTKNGPQGSAPKYINAPETYIASNLFSLWPNEEAIVKVKLPPPFDQQQNLPAGLIKWTVPGHTIPDNTLEAPLAWNLGLINNTKEVKINIGGSEFKLHFKVQGVGFLSEAEASALLPNAAPVMLFHRQEAIDYGATFPAGPQQDAMRHSYWCSLSVSTYPVTAGDVSILSQAHEYRNRYDNKQQACSSAMDLKNNDVGKTVNHQVDGHPDRAPIKADLTQKYAAGEMFIWEIPRGKGPLEGDSEGILIKSNHTRIFP